MPINEDKLQYLNQLLGDSWDPGLPPNDAGQRIIDADTIEQPDGTRVRIAGMDAPETGKASIDDTTYQPEQAGAQEAIDYLDKLISEGAQVEYTGEQTYGREVANLTDAQGNDVATRMIERGVARPTMFSTPEQARASITADVRNSGLFDEAFSTEELMRNRRLAYQREINQFDPNYGNSPIGPDLTRGTLSKSVSRGVDSTQGLLYAAANAMGQATGFDPLEQWGEEGLVRNMEEAALYPAEIESLDDIESLADFGTYVIEALGEQAPNLAMTATGAGATALIGRAAIGKALLKKAGKRFAGLEPVGGAAEYMKRIVAKDAAELMAKSKAVKYLPAAGAAATSYPLGVGEIQQELRDAGIEAPGTALVGGMPIAALDAASFDVVFGSLFRGVKRKVAEDLVEGVARPLGLTREVLAGMGKGGAKGVIAEVPTELAQEVITLAARAYEDPTFEVFSDENLARLKEVAAKAGIVGGAGGAFTGGVQTVREQAGVSLPPPPISDTPAPSAPPQGGPSSIEEVADSLMSKVEAEVARENLAASRENNRKSTVGKESLQQVETYKDPSFETVERPQDPSFTIDDIPSDYSLEVELPDGTVAKTNAKKYIQENYDNRIDALNQLLKCMAA